MRTLQALVALIGVHQICAECANACSGNGDCGAKDECYCYNGYQGNDCSERTCYFGIAHVDSPKGDLNGDGNVQGPLDTVLTGSEVYPWGTTEQYPNSDANEGHFYMECSNRGLCNRDIGVCECFEGYEGTACMRKMCPSGGRCSGHGTCETIKELAEWKGYETRDSHMPITSPQGAHNFDSAIEESYAYDLWDAEKSTGCKCDPGFWGVDCSLRKCKYGIDPIYYAKMDGAIHQTAVVHLGSKGAGRGSIGGTFKIVFFDAFGEKYTTKNIDATRATSTPKKVRDALQALPGDVISKQSHNVGLTPPHAVQVSMASNTGLLEDDGGVGAGTMHDFGAGIGTEGGTSTGGVEFTITFSTNPGLLKAIEIDTRQVTAPATADFWTASQRVGQFSTRYTTLIDKVAACKYGSTKLYPSNDMTSWAPAGSVVKIGGQELRVETVKEHVITFGEPYLGPDILPSLRPTSVTATAFNAATNILVITAPKTRFMVEALKAGGKLYIGGCPFVSADYDVHTGATQLQVEADHDCHDDIFSSSPIVYSMAALDGSVVEDVENGQDIYLAPSDTCSETQSLALTRGSADAYIVEPLMDDASVQIYATHYVRSTYTFTITDIGTTTLAVGTPIFINGHGPFTVQAALANNAVAVVVDMAANDIFTSDLSGGHFYPIYKVVSDTSSITAATNVLALAGRRYKVSAVGAAGTTGAVANGKITLGDVFTSGLVRVCEACVTDMAADGQSITTATKITVAVGDQLMVGGYVAEDLAITVRTALTSGTTVVTSKGCWSGSCGGAGTAPATLSGLSGTNRKDLYKRVNTIGYTGAKCTESATAGTFQYVSQCSNRGYCDGEAGLCKCFSGYTNDNCDTQNAVLM